MYVLLILYITERYVMKSCVELKLRSHIYLHYEPQGKIFLKLHLNKKNYSKLRLCARL
jgi:hypothetical protein